jgi:CheY-like chemotaxis protein
MFANLWRRARTVLIVADDLAQPGFDGAFLREPEIRLLTSHPDEEGLDLARRERPHLIIEDLDTPADEGLHFCRRLRSERATRAIPLIVVSSPGRREGAAEARADVLIEKPVSRPDLYRAVRRFLPLPHRRSQRVATNLRFTFVCDGQRYQAFSRDVSDRGAFLKTDRLPALGTRIELTFRLPGCWSEVRCAGVVRTAAGGDGHGIVGGIGVEFAGLASEDAERLAGFIDRQLGRAFA